MTVGRKQLLRGSRHFFVRSDFIRKIKLGFWRDVLIASGKGNLTTHTGVRNVSDNEGSIF